MATFKRYILVFLISVASEQIYGQVEDSNGAFEFWSRMNFRWITKKSTQHNFEFQYRNQQRTASLQERFQVYTFRWSIQKRWNSFYLQGSPICFFERLPSEGSLVNEYRLTQYAGWFLSNDKFQIRAGIEGRFFWSDGNHYEEIRERVRLLSLIPVNDQLKIQVFDEILVHQRTSGNEVPFFDQNRASIGVSYEISKKWIVDSGYQLHTRVFTKGQPENFNIFYLYLTYLL